MGVLPKKKKVFPDKKHIFLPKQKQKNLPQKRFDQSVRKKCFPWAWVTIEPSNYCRDFSFRTAILCCACVGNLFFPKQLKF